MQSPLMIGCAAWRLRVPAAALQVRSRPRQVGRAPQPCRTGYASRTLIASSAPGLRSAQPHLHRDCAQPSHICTGTALSPATSAPGLRSVRPHLRRSLRLWQTLHSSCADRVLSASAASCSRARRRAHSRAPSICCGIQYPAYNAQRAACSTQHDTQVGLHPDEATDAIVDVALQLNIPFAVVPCCVFPNSFAHVRSSNNGASVAADGHRSLASRARRSAVPFPAASA